MISVYLMRRPGRFIECQWVDPITGKLKTKSTKTHKQREAERFLGLLEHQLNSGGIEESANASWETVAERYEKEVLASLAIKTRHKFQATRRAVKAIIDPKLASSLNASQVSRYQATLRDKGLAESTIKGHLSALRACLNWAFRAGLIAKVPHFTMPKRTAKMKGRPITAEEYDRMLAVVPRVVGNEFAERWEFMLKGLWTSALRLDEALRLTWDSEGFSINLHGKHPRFKIEVLNDKSKKARLLPMFPEFAELLLSVPENQRHGPVFRPLVADQIVDMRLDTCSKVFTRIGKAAMVLVAEYPPKAGESESRKKWASAHDLRRARLKHWSKLVKPQQLKELARHESITTTMTFYVGDDLDDAENAVWKHSPNTSPNNPESQEVFRHKNIGNS